MNNKKQINVLYLGMEYDIILPMLMVPNFDRIYSYGMTDLCYVPKELVENDEGTSIISREDFDKYVDETDLEIKYKLIKNILLNGRNLHGISFEYEYIPKKCDKCQNRALLGEVEIIDEINTCDGEYILRFTYLGKIRELIMYEGKFEKDWREEIKDIDHIFGQGAVSFDYLMDNEKNFRYKHKEHLRKMFEERTKSIFRFTSNGFINKINNEEYTLERGTICDEAGGPILTKMITKKRDWYNFNVFIDKKYKRHSISIG